MKESTERPGDHVLVECSTLPPRLRNELQVFLEHQPEVRAVTRKLRVSEALLNPETVGLIAPRFDLVVHLTEPSQTSTPADRAAPVLKKVAEWTDANRPREDR